MSRYSSHSYYDEQDALDRERRLAKQQEQEPMCAHYPPRNYFLGRSRPRLAPVHPLKLRRVLVPRSGAPR